MTALGHGFRFYQAVFAALLLIAAPLSAQSTASISGKVSSADGSAVTDAEVTLIELGRVVRVSSDGSFRFDSVPPGHYHVQAESRRLGVALGEADLTTAVARTVDIVLDPAIHSEQIVVTASPDSRRESEVYQPIAVVTEEELAEQLEPTLGETLNSEPGVNSSYFGPGSSRPVIRGLGADRVRILEDGVGTGDASNISPDHAVSVDPGSARQIEILRGPATLLYGSNAVGGVVNVISDRIPERVATQTIGGDVDVRFGTVAGEKTGSLALNGGSGQFAWHADLLARDTGDYEIPDGTLENSSLDARSGTFGASFIGDRGFIGGAVSGFETNYGVPGSPEEEERVRIDLEQRRFDVRAGLTSVGIFRNIRMRIGRNTYEHVELEGGEVGTRFSNEGLEGRLEATHRKLGAFTGSIGVQWIDNDFAAIGEEAFIPANTTSSRAIFGFEEITGPRWDFQFGARYETQEVSAEAAAGLPERDFSGLSGSLGTIFKPREGWAIAASLARAVRHPTATELYSDGAHIATRQFEIGDPTLTEETSLGADLSFRKTSGRFRGELNLFQNYFDGFIYDAPTDVEEDGLRVYRFVQADATFRGVEIDTHTELWHTGDDHLELEGGADFVRASLSDGGGNLPRIPPFRVWAGLRWTAGPISAMAEVRRYSRQERVAQSEEPTDGYTFLNARFGYRFLVANTVHEILLRGTNLTDEVARSHVSALKTFAPVPGRDFSIAYHFTF